MRVYCPYCKKEVEYKIEKRDLEEFKGIKVNTFENVATCNECNQNLYVNEIEDANNERILNKYLWYIDMLSFHERTVSITGLTYQNQRFGPTIIYKKYDELSLLDDKYTREDIETENGNITKIISNNNFNLDKISSSEKEIIDTIIKLLKNKNVTDISEMSHREEGWKKTKRFEQISFEYAMNLKLINK